MLNINMYNNIILIILMISIIIGISLQNILVNDISEFKWINRFNTDNGILLYIVLLYNNVILMLGIISLILSTYKSNTNNKIQLIHMILIIINTIYICNNNNNTIINIILMIISIDIISVINIILIQRGEGIWYYFLYQSLMTILIWWILILDFTSLLSLIYYYKLGSGIGGYYIPSLYSSIIYKNISLMVYIGTTNIILMYNPIFLFNYFNNNFNYILNISNFLFIIYILYIWIYNGYIFINIWLYSISFSTIILANIYYLFTNIDFIYYNLFYYIYFFTITSIIIWFIFILSLYFINTNNNF